MTFVDLVPAVVVVVSVVVVFSVVVVVSVVVEKLSLLLINAEEGA